MLVHDKDFDREYIDDGDDNRLDVAAQALEALVPMKKGGPGSGNHGHAGRPGQRGGSAPDGVGSPVTAEALVAPDAKLQEPDYLSEARWDSKFIETAKAEVANARKFLEIVPPVSAEQINEGFNSHYNRVYDDTVKSQEVTVQAYTVQLENTRKELAEARTAQSAMTDEAARQDKQWVIDRLESEVRFGEMNLAGAKEVLERISNPIAKAALHKEIQKVADKLSEAKTLGEQKSLMEDYHRGAVNSLTKAYRDKSANARLHRQLADINYNVMRNRAAQFRIGASDSLKGYMESHNAFIMEEIGKVGDDVFRNARRAVSGQASKTVEARPNFQQGRDWIMNNIHPSVLAKVGTPVAWEAKRGGSGGRSWYRGADQTITLAKDDRPGTIPHEFVHHLERQVPEISNFFAGYYVQRTGYEQPIKMSKVLGGGYRPSEYTRLDAWADPYMGHVNIEGYGGERRGGGEIFSQAVALLANPQDAARLYIKDPQLFGITMSILKGNLPTRKIIGPANAT